MEEDTIDVSGIDHGELLAALYNHARPLGMGWLRALEGDMTAEEARRVISDGDDHKLKQSGFVVLNGGMEWSVDYVHGRPLKVGVKDGRLYGARIYDRDQGEGLCARVVAELREKAKFSL